jgi:hypothetical protein
MYASAASWVAAIFRALVVVVALDATAKHRIDAPAIEAHARKFSEVASCTVRSIPMLAGAVDRVTGIDCAWVVVIAVDAFASAGKLTDAVLAAAGGTVPLANDAVLHRRVAADSRREAACVIRAIIAVVAVFRPFARRHAASSAVPTRSAVPIGVVTRSSARRRVEADRHPDHPGERQ